MSKNEDRGRAIRESIQAAVDRAKDEKKRELFKKRLHLAKRGLDKFRGREVAEAVRAFHTYIRILEEWKGCGDGELTPAHFDRRMEMSEMLLLSGVYWDLAKLYDRTRSKERYTEFRQYLHKYIIFSKGMPYEILAGETMRKYIWNEKAVHKKEFKEAYRKLTGHSCFVVTSLQDVGDEKTLERLRHFRDQVLRCSWWGRCMISIYWFIGPMLASGLDRMPRAGRVFMARRLDQLANLVSVRFAPGETSSVGTHNPSIKRARS